MSFAQDSKTQLAILYALSIIGEATKKLSPEFRTQHSTTALRAVIGNR
ncbi:DUF86 domain-containing protein [Roseofilum sp. SID3]